MKSVAGGIGGAVVGNMVYDHFFRGDSSAPAQGSSDQAQDATMPAPPQQDMSGMAGGYAPPPQQDMGGAAGGGYMADFGGGAEEYTYDQDGDFSGGGGDFDGDGGEW